MDLFAALRRRLRGDQLVTSSAPPPVPPSVEEEEPYVPEIEVRALFDEVEQGAMPYILDIREPFELTQVHLPDSDAWTLRHIPMNDLPDQLGELPTDREITVLCAHGTRSYSVTHYLNEQGFDARNLAGGITQWHIRGGPVQTGSA